MASNSPQDQTRDQSLGPRLDVGDDNSVTRRQVITASRQELLEARRDIVHAALRGRLSDRDAALHYRAEMQNHLLAISQYRDLDREALLHWTGGEGKSIGPVIVHPPSEASMCEPKQVDKIRGLDDLLSGPMTYTTTFESVQRRPGYSQKTMEHTAVGYASMSLLDEGFRWINSFERHVGLDLDTPEKEDADGGVF